MELPTPQHYIPCANSLSYVEKKAVHLEIHAEFRPLYTVGTQLSNVSDIILESIKNRNDMWLLLNPINVGNKY